MANIIRYYESSIVLVVRIVTLPASSLGIILWKEIGGTEFY
ncbi:MAG: hypothetical protein NWE84_09450 [Candidatus Bathyarchaeota archaeon]|nr:hypothetical protein [Candidatus Bathyarchaeota archaeon]